MPKIHNYIQNQKIDKGNTNQILQKKQDENVWVDLFLTAYQIKKGYVQIKIKKDIGKWYFVNNPTELYNSMDVVETDVGTHEIGFITIQNYFNIENITVIVVQDETTKYEVEYIFNGQQLKVQLTGGDNIGKWYIVGKENITYNSNDIVLLPSGIYQIGCTTVEHWSIPEVQEITLSYSNDIKNISCIYTLTTSRVYVTIENGDGLGRFYINDNSETLYDSTILYLSPGEYTLTSVDINDSWITPTIKNIIVENNLQINVVLKYDIVTPRIIVTFEGTEDGMWKIAGTNQYYIHNEKVSINPGTYFMEFKDVDNFVTPVNKIVVVNENDIIRIVEKYYDVTEPLPDLPGTVHATGAGYRGELGDGTDNSDVTFFKEIPDFAPQDIIKIYASDYSRYAINTKNELYFWGYNEYLSPNTQYNIPIKLMDNVLSVTTSCEMVYIITTDYKVYCFGKNNKGQLGINSMNNVYNVYEHPFLNNIKQIANGIHHGIALTTTGEIYVWGDNAYGQLGLDDIVGSKGSVKPIKVPNITNVRKVYASFYSTAYITTDNELYSCGSYLDNMQLSNSVNFSSFSKIEHFSDVKDIVMSSSGYFIFLMNGDIYYKFYNAYIENNNTNYNTQPIKLTTIKNIKNIVFETYYNNILISDDEYNLYCVGDVDRCGFHNQDPYAESLYYFTKNNAINLPVSELAIGYKGSMVLVPAIPGKITIKILNDDGLGKWYIYGFDNIYDNMYTLSLPPGVYYVYFTNVEGKKQPRPLLIVVRSNMEEEFVVEYIFQHEEYPLSGFVYGCGYNGGCYLLGNGEMEEYAYYNYIKCETLSDITNIFFVGESAAYAINSNNVMYYWGDEYKGRGNVPSPYYPQIHTTNVKKLASIFDDTSNQFYLMIKIDNSLYTWGNNEYGQLGLGITGTEYSETLPKANPILVNNVVDVAMGYYHAMALLDSGEVYVWGRNHKGQLGLSDTVNRDIPTKVEGFSNIKGICCCGDTSFIILENGDVYSCGEANYNGHDNGDKYVFTKILELSDIVDIKAGINHVLALTKYDESIPIELTIPITFNASLENIAWLWEWDWGTPTETGFSNEPWGTNHPRNGGTPAPLPTGYTTKPSWDWLWLWDWDLGTPWQNILPEPNLGKATTDNFDTRVFSILWLWDWDWSEVYNLSDPCAWGNNAPWDSSEPSYSSGTVQPLPPEYSDRPDWSWLWDWTTWWDQDAEGEYNVPWLSAKGSPWRITKQTQSKVVENGVVYSWGNNSYGQLGLNHTNDMFKPTKINTIQNIIQIACGKETSFISNNDFLVYSFGSNNSGKLGFPQHISNQLTPKIQNAINKPLQLIGGCEVSYAIILQENGYLQIIIHQEDYLDQPLKWFMSYDDTLLYDSETQITLRPGKHIVSFTSIEHEENVFYTVKNVEVEIIQNKINVLHVYAAYLQNSEITVNINNDDSLGKWYIKNWNDETQYNEGETIQLAPGTYYIHFVDISDDYVTPDPILLQLEENESKIIEANYIKKGEIEIFILGIPEEYTAWYTQNHRYNSGEVIKVIPGTYYISFTYLYGYVKPNNISNLKVVAGERTSRVVYYTKIHGDVYVTGSNRYKQLGSSVSSMEKINTFEKVRGLDHVYRVAAVKNQSYAVKTNGTVFAWGQFGSKIVVHPKQMFFPENVEIMEIASSSTANHTLALSIDGDVYAWGDNTYGQLGFESENSLVLIPTKIETLSNIKYISIGEKHSLALTKTGALYVWGDNTYGQLGLGDIPQTTITEPTIVSVLLEINKIEGGSKSSAILTPDGYIYICGSHKENGLGVDVNVFTELRIYGCNLTRPLEFNSIQIETDSAFVIGRAATTGDYFWGESTGHIYPIRLKNSTYVELNSVCLGHNFVIALGINGNILGYGVNESGQLGNGTYEPQEEIQKITTADVVSMATGNTHTMVVHKNLDPDPDPEWENPIDPDLPIINPDIDPIEDDIEDPTDPLNPTHPDTPGELVDMPIKLYPNPDRDLINDPITDLTLYASTTMSQYPYGTIKNLGMTGFLNYTEYNNETQTWDNVIPSDDKVLDVCILWRSNDLGVNWFPYLINGNIYQLQNNVTIIYDTQKLDKAFNSLLYSPSFRNNQIFLLNNEYANNVLIPNAINSTDWIYKNDEEWKDQVNKWWGIRDISIYVWMNRGKFNRIVAFDDGILLAVFRDATFHPQVLSHEPIQKVFKSIDNGQTFHRTINVPNHETWIGHKDMAYGVELVNIGNNTCLLYSYTKGYWKSTDFGASWQIKAWPQEVDLLQKSKVAVVENGDCYIIIGQSLYKSTDKADSWVLVREITDTIEYEKYVAGGSRLLSENIVNRYTAPYFAYSCHQVSLCYVGNGVFLVGLGRSLFKLTGFGSTYYTVHTIPNKDPNDPIEYKQNHGNIFRTVYALDGGICFATSDNNIWRSEDNGETWSTTIKTDATGSFPRFAFLSEIDSSMGGGLPPLT